MKKIVGISFQEPFKILCSFNNGEQRVLDLEKALDSTKKYTKQILKEAVFKQAKVGKFGEIYWTGIAEMKDIKAHRIPCEYDICPDFAYSKSVPLLEELEINH